MKRLIIAIAAVIITFIGTTFITSKIILNGDKILTNFSIISVDNISTNFNVKFEKVKAAKYYDIIVYDASDIKVYEQTVYKNTANIDLNMLEYNTEYKLLVYAYDILGDSKSINNPYVFKYMEPSFNTNNSLVLTDNTNYTLDIDGILSHKTYNIKLSSNGKIIKEEKLSTNNYIIDKTIFTDKEFVLDVEIYDGLTAIDKITLYNKISPVSDLKITSPSNNVTLDYNDVILTYNGGANATKYLVQIYNGKTLVREKEVKKNRCVINSEIFKKAEEYLIKISAIYENYTELTKTAEVKFLMNEKDTLKPAYINVYPKYVKAGTSIEISNPNPDGIIYYTIDGTDPTVQGIKYTEPIIATKNMHLKTVVMEPLKNNSVISDYEINIGSKPTYSVYLSPSNQDGNIGVLSTGYTNEMREMNDLANYIEKRLKSKGIKVYRNSPSGNINRWTSDSQYYGVDLHFALHSNASTDHTAYGVETWINEQTSKTYSLANLLQNALIGIYYNEAPESNRGVKYANGALGEVNDLYVPFGILLEVAHHDYETDAAWMMQNKALIGNTIADAILKYFGIN